MHSNLNLLIPGCGWWIFLKLKLNSFWLVCIILIQVILIETLIVVSFIKNSDTLPRPAQRTQKNVVNRKKPKKSSTVQISKSGTTKFSFVKEKNIFYDNLFLRSPSNSEEQRDFRLLLYD